MPIRSENMSGQNRHISHLARQARKAPLPERLCAICGTPFLPYSKAAQYCGRVDIWGRECLGEVKFSQAFYADYGKHSRHIFKWLMSKPQVRNRTADAVILIGVDQDRLIYAWVIPRDAMPPGKRTITTTAPSDRRPTICGRIDPYAVPVTELLPAFAAACHNRLDAKSRRANAAITVHDRKAGTRDMFERSA